MENKNIKYDQKKIYVEKSKDFIVRAKEIKVKKLDKKNNKKKGWKDSETEEEKKKLEEQLSGCIVQEKPNLNFEDLTSLERAKEALKKQLFFLKISTIISREKKIMESYSFI